METLTLPDAAASASEPTLNLLLPRDAEYNWQPGQRAVVWSVAFHVVTVLVLLTVKVGPKEQVPPDRYFVKHLTPLYIPPELTQRAPNKEVKKELTLETIAPRPALKAPAPAAAPKQTSVAKALPMPAPTPQAPPKAIASVEPPRIEAPPQIAPQQPAQIAGMQQLPPPPGSGAPKITFENVAPPQAPTGKPTGVIPLPSASVQDAVKTLNRGGTTGGSVGEMTFDQGGSGPGMNLPASPGQANGGIKLLSDTNGVDFKPYLTQIMAAIRRNWFAVYPEAAKTGVRGEVILQFRVTKNGKVAKVVYNGQSSSRALDLAAVAAISASDPFAPLPVEFRGDHVDLQVRFMYNMPR